MSDQNGTRPRCPVCDEEAGRFHSALLGGQVPNTCSRECARALLLFVVQRDMVQQMIAFLALQKAKAQPFKIPDLRA